MEGIKMGYLGVFVQDEAEFTRNLALVDKRILPGVLAPTKQNADVVTAYLRKNCTKDGLIDGTADNIYRAFADLRSLLDWKVEPKKMSNKLFQMERNTEIPNHARDNSEDVKAKIKVLDDASKARDRADADAIISSAVSLAKNVSRATHSKSYALREQLQGMIDASLKKMPMPSPQQAQAIFNLVQEKERATY
jgi:hypothetical protein